MENLKWKIIGAAPLIPGLSGISSVLYLKTETQSNICFFPREIPDQVRDEGIKPAMRNRSSGTFPAYALSPLWG